MYQTNNSINIDLKLFWFIFSIFCRREFGLERFLPPSLMENMKRKELRRLIGHFMKLNQQMTGSSKMLTQLQVRKRFKFCFIATFLNANGARFYLGTLYSRIFFCQMNPCEMKNSRLNPFKVYNENSFDKWVCKLFLVSFASCTLCCQILHPF